MKCNKANNYESPIIILIQAKQEHIFQIISKFHIHLNNKHVNAEIILKSYASTRPTPVTSPSRRRHVTSRMFWKARNRQ